MKLGRIAEGAWSAIAKMKKAYTILVENGMTKLWNEVGLDRTLHSDHQWSIVCPPLYQPFNNPTLQMKCSNFTYRGVLIITWVLEVMAQVAKS
jgi:hypothetical protein